MQQEKPAASSPITIFYSCAPEDEADQAILEVYLSPLRQKRLIVDWHHRKILPGKESEREIDVHMSTAQIILLLVSADYLASNYHFNTEMLQALQRRANGEARVIPILLRLCEWEESPLSGLHALPTNHKPISQWQDRDAAFLDVAKGIRAVVNELIGESSVAEISNTQEQGESVTGIPTRPRSYIPFPRNLLFQPRPDEFEQLEHLLLGTRTGNTPTRLGLIGMVGMGGVGKTQLAVELAYRYRQCFPDGVFWVTATGTNQYDWQRTLAELAARTDYLPPDDNPSNPESESRRARHLCRYLASHAGALLILDNVEDPGLVVSALPALAGGELSCAILYTSRATIKPNGVTTYPVEQLPEEAALHLLLETTRPALLSEILVGNSSPEAQASRTVCQGVGYLPLALVHLRGLLERDKHLTLVRLAQVLKERGALEVAKKQYLDAAPLFATFWLSWEKVSDEDAQRLFKLASYFPEAAPIPLWLLGLAARLGENQDILEPLGQARMQLQELSLMEVLSGDQARLHPLVRAFGRQLVAENGDKRKVLLEEAGVQLESEFTNLHKLEQRAQRLGYWRCLEQVRAARTYTELLATERKERLQQIERWLDRESHLFTDGRWWPKMIPGLFYQQLYNHLIEEGHPHIVGEAPTRWLCQVRQVGAEDRSLLRIYTGHSDWVRSVAFSPDGSKVITGSGDKITRLWDAASGRILMTLHGHSAAVSSVAFSPDGTKVLTGSDDGTALLWDTASGRSLVIFDGHSEAVTSVAFSPDGTKVLTGSVDQTAHLWDAANGSKLATLHVHAFFVSSVAFSPDGTKVLTGSDIDTAQVWEVTSGRKLMTLYGHSQAVLSVAFSSDGTKMLTGSIDKTACVWDAATGRELSTLRGHTSAVSSAVFSPDGTKVLTGSWDWTARLWDTATAYVLTTLHGHASSVLSVAFNSDGTQVLTGSVDRSARLWEVASGRKLLTDGHKSLVNSVSFSPNGTQVLTSSDDRTARLWETASGRTVLVLDGHSDSVLSVAFSGDGTKVLTGSFDRTARLWDAATGRELATLRGHTSAVNSAVFSPDGTKVLTGSWDQTARLWEAASGRVLAILEGHTSSIGGVAFSPDGSKVLTGSGDRTARLWDAINGRTLAILEGHKSSVGIVMFSPDGSKVLTGSTDRTARLWDAASGHTLAKLGGHESSVHSAAFSPDSRFVITCDEHGQVHLFQVSGAGKGSLLGIYIATYEIGAVHWHNATYVILADIGGPRGRPHFYHLKLEGMW